MMACIACIVVIGMIAIWQARRATHYQLLSLQQRHDNAIERAKRMALAWALSDVEAGLRRGDAGLCAQAMSAALRVARDDTDETIRKLGFTLPERPR